MTNGQLFIKENPTIEVKINGSCVWIYFDGVNHYTMPVKWWDKEIDVLDKIRAEMVKQAEEWKSYNSNSVAYKNIANGLYRAVNVIDKYMAESEDKE